MTDPKRPIRRLPSVDLNPPQVKAQQSRRGGARRLTEHEIDAAWAEIQARHRAGLGWKAPQPRRSKS